MNAEQSHVVSDRPLTDAQERALIFLADRAPVWCLGATRSVTTLQALERRGLAEVRPYLGYGYFRWEARITSAGLELIGTMGD